MLSVEIRFKYLCSYYKASFDYGNALRECFSATNYKQLTGHQKINK